jgi:hypothetical protein
MNKMKQTLYVGIFCKFLNAVIEATPCLTEEVLTEKALECPTWRYNSRLSAME